MESQQQQLKEEYEGRFKANEDNLAATNQKLEKYSEMNRELKSKLVKKEKEFNDVDAQLQKAKAKLFQTEMDLQNSS